MSVALSVFMPLVLPEVKGAPRVLVQKQILEAAIEWCIRTKTWTETQDTYAVGSSVADYVFETPANAVVHQIMSATLDGQELDAHSREWCDDNFPGWRDGGQTGMPRAVTQYDHECFYLVPAPTNAMELVLEVAYKPKKTATTLPDFMYQEYEEPISFGALARLHAMRGQAWTDLKQAGLRATQFTAAVDMANSQQARGYGRAALRVRGQYL